MNWLFSQILSYGFPAIIAFVAIAYIVARKAGWAGVLIGHIVIALLVSIFDVIWIQREMREPGWVGTPDMDIIFHFGVLIRVLTINVLLLPISYFGVWMHNKFGRAKKPPSVD